MSDTPTSLSPLTTRTPTQRQKSPQNKVHTEPGRLGLSSRARQAFQNTRVRANRDARLVCGEGVGEREWWAGAKNKVGMCYYYAGAGLWAWLVD